MQQIYPHWCEGVHFTESTISHVGIMLGFLAIANGTLTDA